LRRPSKVSRKKKLQAQCLAERHAETEDFLRQARSRFEKMGEKGTEELMQWFEVGLRDALLRDGRRMIQALLNDRQLLPDQAPAKPLETRYVNRVLQVETLFGRIQLRRSYYHHRKSGHGRFPLDEALDLVRGHTPALARLICRAATQSGSYTEAAADLEAYSGLHLDSRGFGRLVGEVAPILREALATLPPATGPNDPVPVLYVSSDGTGVPMRREQLKGVKGKQPDGSAHTRELKLGCVFTQTTTDEQGQPLRDPGSTSYIGTLEDCRVAGILLRQEAFRRGYATAKKVVYLGDGSAWVWENARLNFPDAEQIIDFYHASEHIGHLAAALWGTGTPQAKEWQTHWCRIIKDSDTLAMIRAADTLLTAADHPPLDEARRQIAQREIHYFVNQQQRTRYGYFRSQGWFIGSGVVEAGCKTIVGRRMKQSGMFWSQHGGEDLISLRCLIKGPHFDPTWKARTPILIQQRAKARRWAA
jgi:hypothetical protein